ncbi:FTR1 family protein [Gordonia phthalatica]|uniref:Uncharacterized protein n=1 Tax=Gordonia phthalatica TaxID=1136941 RepID=A0A0N9NIZ4_9ACTN|nr:FTR1 family protein [Gordonia phthalatica]ALG85554.1 hypothetical protein ACH46_15075 [Gordonia phthalatica]
MSFSIGLPNLIIGLRESLEAGLVITILLAAIRRGTGDRRDIAAIWIGVVAALSVSISAAVVLTAGLDALPATGQSILSGLLGLLAVVLVTRMIFTMRATARTMKRDITEKVTAGAQLGTAALMLTAFTAVARESLEATLFLWTASRQTGDASGALVGAVVGIALGLGLAYLLYRRALSLNLATFFTYTAVLLAVVIAGILAYSIGELQNVGWIPGRTAVAWDVSASIDASSWWMAIITALTGIAVHMTVIQVTAWVAYLVVVLWCLFRVPASAPAADGEPSRFDAVARRIAGGGKVVGALILIVPIAIAATVATLLPKSVSTESTVTVADGSCGADAAVTSAGAHTFTVVNKSSRTGEVTFEDVAGNILGEIETLAPKTSAPMHASIPAGNFRFHCAMAGTAPAYSPVIAVSGVDDAPLPTPKAPVSDADLQGPADALRADVLTRLSALHDASQALAAAVASGDTAAAQQRWRDAIWIWQQSSASYRAFGELGDAVGGEPWGLPGGVDDPSFRGLRRLEYGLWNGQSTEVLAPIAARLTTDVDALRAAVAAHDDRVALDPKDIPLRAHEVLEEAERHLTNGFSDLGAGTEYFETDAMIANTRVVLACLEPLLTARAPQLLAQSQAALDHLQQVLTATARTPQGTWLSRHQISPDQRLAINAALSSTLEVLAQLPGVLEPPLARTPGGN